MIYLSLRQEELKLQSKTKKEKRKERKWEGGRRDGLGVYLS